MTVPAPGTQIAITSLGRSSKALNNPISSVKLLGSTESLNWSQDDNALHITCPNSLPFKTSICFKINLN